MDVGSYHAPREPIAIAPEDSQKHQAQSFDSQTAVRLLAACPNAQDATGMNEEALLGRLCTPWSIEIALQAGEFDCSRQHSFLLILRYSFRARVDPTPWRSIEPGTKDSARSHAYRKSFAGFTEPSQARCWGD
jgi:hypothetical protein